MTEEDKEGFLSKRYQERLDKMDPEAEQKKYESKATEYMIDREKSKKLFKDAGKKASRSKTSLGKAWDKLQLLLEVGRAWIKGEYREIPVGSIVLIVSAIIYFVSPIDLIPDFILGFGLLDDAAIIGFTVRQVSKDLEKYRVWKETQQTNDESDLTAKETDAEDLPLQ